MGWKPTGGRGNAINTKDSRSIKKGEWGGLCALRWEKERERERKEKDWTLPEKKVIKFGKKKFVACYLIKDKHALTTIWPTRIWPHNCWNTTMARSNPVKDFVSRNTKGGIRSSCMTEKLFVKLSMYETVRGIIHFAMRPPPSTWRNQETNMQMQRSWACQGQPE